MNTTKQYLEEISYRKVKSCFGCAFCVPIESGGWTSYYCSLHDNPTGADFVCKYFKPMEEAKLDG